MTFYTLRKYFGSSQVPGPSLNVTLTPALTGLTLNEPKKPTLTLILNETKPTLNTKYTTPKKCLGLLSDLVQNFWNLPSVKVFEFLKSLKALLDIYIVIFVKIQQAVMVNNNIPLLLLLLLLLLSLLLFTLNVSESIGVFSCDVIKI